MHALVIGGNRFFGKRLVERLLVRGMKVTLLNRGQAPDPFDARVERIRMDRKELRTGHPLVSAARWDVIYDQVCYDAPEAQGACEAFRGKTARYVFTSSQSVYGPGSDIPESAFDPARHRFDTPVDRNLEYAEAKRQAETVFHRESAFPLTAVRFPIVMGEDDYTARLRFHVEHIARGIPFHLPTPDARISFVRSADAAAFLEYLLDHPIEGPINFSSPDPVRLSDLITLIERICGKKAVLTEAGTTVETSPYGIPSDWFMSTARADALGFRALPCSDWLEPLIRHEFNNLQG